MKSISIRNGMAVLALIAMASCETAPPLPPADPSPAVLAPPSCHDRTFPVYFASGESALDEQAESVIARVVSEAQSCTLSAIEVESHSAASGSANTNMLFSQNRADAVLDAILAAGISADTVSIKAIGEGDAVTEDNLMVPMNRRVVVRFVE